MRSQFGVRGYVVECCASMLKLTNNILDKIRESHNRNLGLIDQLVFINQGKEVDFKIDENGVMRFRGRVCIPDFLELKNHILEEGHKSGLSIHLGATKMYQDLKMFWWAGKKKDVVEFVYSCLTCQKSKFEHEKSPGLMQPLSILGWKWDTISMDFVFGLPKTAKGSDYIWVIINRLTKSTNFLSIKVNYPLQKLERFT